jgi:long-chain acyl-CoA synthetase
MNPIIAPNVAQFLSQWQAQPQRVLYRQFVAAQQPWADITAGQLIEGGCQWQAAFRAAGLVAGDRVAICARNSVPWVQVDLAALGMGLVVVPLYVDDNAGNMAYCTSHSGASLLVLDAVRQAKQLLATDVPLPPMWVLRCDADETLPAQCLSASSQLAKAQANLIDTFECQAVTADTLATICYTSGTGGRPKGVMLSHGNIVANVTACQSLGIARADDVFLSFLPLSHMFERTGGYYLPLSMGATVAHAQSVATLADDLLTQQPTALFAVPRIFEKFHAKLAQTMQDSAIKRRLYDCNVAWGWAAAQGTLRNPFKRMALPLLNTLVAKKVLARMGGRLRVAVAGGAALESGIARTFIGLGLPILHGYGMTEASPVIAVNRMDSNVPESVGQAMPDLAVRLGEHQELQVRGASVMQGYWQDTSATQKALVDGWLHTGDVAEITDGRIFIRGRIKDILVLSNGEKCPPQDMELAILGDPAFEQIMLVGEAKPFLSLIVVSSTGSDEKALMKKANERLKDFPKWMRVRRVITTSQAWSVDNGLLTPTLKVKRAKVAEHFATQMNKVYGEKVAD